ncbi:peptidoglycan-binding protein [Oceanobacillus longus]|uniref:Peptidoglycan-binding protein n=1 Tax=Oceanobacillus longus TaxID=930120 RepID=A0ABV8H3S6_9BACI
MGKYAKVVLFFLLFLIIPVGAMNAEPSNEPVEAPENVLIVKEDLHKLGFYHGNPDDVIEEDLQSAIKQFQKYHGLVDTGIVDEDTAKKLESELQGSYFYGDQDVEMVEIQQDLMTLGFGEWVPSDEFESSTEEAVLAFQEYHSDLKVTGVLDTKTQAKIKVETEKTEQTDVVEETKPKEQEESVETSELTEQEESVETSELAEQEESVETSELAEQEESVETSEAAVQEARATTAFVFMAETENTLQKGMRSNAVKELQEILIRLGFGNWKTTTYFGSTTEGAVEDFQSYHGLTVNGIYDTNTQEKLESELQNTYFYGNRSTEILELQNRLIMLGYGKWNPTVRFGPTTESAVLAFQETYSDLKVTGVLDTKTQAKLKQETEVLKKGLRSDEVKELQEDLIRLGFGNWNPTTYFGSTTEGALKEFQEYHGLSVNGTFDENTKRKLESELKETYFYGDRDSEIVDLQNRLIILGFGNWDPTVRFGPTTERAVLALQEAYSDLKVTGVLDSKTQAKLRLETEGLLQKGMRSDAVKELQQELIRLGFGNWDPTTYYGSTTERAVKDFQKYYGLNVNGIYDKRTKEKLEEVGNLPLGPGLKRPDVKTYQEKLMRLGFATWTNATDCFCTQTTNATREFQAYHGLQDTGIVDQNTAKKLESELQESYFYNDRDEEIVDLQNRLIKLGFGNWDPTVRFGPTTERAVLSFQEYYSGLKVTGVLDTRTQARIIHETEETLQKEMRSDAVKELQQNLIRLGFGSWSPTTYYGPTTENAVKEFQAYFNLNVNGIFDTRTQEKLEEVLNSPYQYGKTSDEIRVLQEQLIELGFGNWSPTNFFGSITEEAVRTFQEHYGLPVSGIADEITLSRIASALKGIDYTSYDLSLEQAAQLQLQLTNPPPQTDKHYAYVSKAYIENNKVTAGVLNVRTGAGTAYKVIGQLSEGTNVNILEEVNDWYRIEFRSSEFVNASKDDVLYYLDPTNFLDEAQQRFQFLNLSRVSSASEILLNEYLQGKGILRGHGQTFIEASLLHGVNDIYLLSHALLETGHGQSELANGVEVGKDKNGNLVLVTSSNRSSLTDIKTTYNMFGIGANDGVALRNGAIRAYEEGWFSPRDAIIGGAGFIGNNYVKAGQNTLYKMRWNPAAMALNNRASHQYATDIGWASKQTRNMYNLYQEIGITAFYLDIPVYK